MRLYLRPRCPFGHRAVFALTEKQLPFEAVFFERGRRPPDLEAVGPRAQSPTLIDDDAAVHDSLVVLEYLEDRYPERPLLPTGAAARADVRMRLTRVLEELFPRFGALVAEALFAAQPDREKIGALEREFVDALPPWDRVLEGRTYLGGDLFTIADIVLYTMFPAAKGLVGVEVPDRLVHLRGWLERMAARSGARVPMPA